MRRARRRAATTSPASATPPSTPLIERIVNAQDRETLTTAARALDRVLLWRWFVVPNWHSSTFHIAYWDRFGYPDKPIREGFNFDTWWVDAAKSAAIEAAKRAVTPGRF
ncbi:MAG: hypothetical protein WDN25_26680 [Acetobacteraceae bacterium]